MTGQDRDGLKRLIEYAKIEAREQREDLAAYLLDLAARCLVLPERPGGQGDRPATLQ